MNTLKSSFLKNSLSRSKSLSKNSDLNGTKHIMIIAGEPSGDFHGANLLKELKQKRLSIRFSGIGGDLMKKEGMELFFHIEKLSVMGITEVIAQIKTIKKAFNIFRQRVCQQDPDLLILIDYPGFNLKAAAFAKKKINPCFLLYNS